MPTVHFLPSVPSSSRASGPKEKAASILLAPISQNSNTTNKDHTLYETPQGTLLNILIYLNEL